MYKLTFYVTLYYIIDTAGILCRAGSVKRLSVRLSACLSVHLSVSSFDNNSGV